MLFRLKWVSDIFTMLTLGSAIILVLGHDKSTYSAVFLVSALGMAMCYTSEYKSSVDPTATKKLLSVKLAVLVVMFVATYLLFK